MTILHGKYTLKNSRRKALVTVINPSEKMSGLEYQSAILDRIQRLIDQTEDLNLAKEAILEPLRAINQEEMLYLPETKPETWGSALIAHPLMSEALNQEVPEEVSVFSLKKVTEEDSPPEQELSGILYQLVNGKRER